MSNANTVNFIKNSFYVETTKKRYLYTPSAITSALHAQIERKNIHVINVNVNKFFGKNDGGPKYIIFNLNEVDTEDPRLSTAQHEFRRTHHIETLRQTRW